MISDKELAAKLRRYKEAEDSGFVSRERQKDFADVLEFLEAASHSGEDLMNKIETTISEIENLPLPPFGSIVKVPEGVEYFSQQAVLKRLKLLTFSGEPDGVQK